MINTDTNIITTDELSLSAFLLCNSCVLERIIQSPDISGKYLFIFTKTENSINLQKEFHSFKKCVEPQAYYQAIKDVKRMLIQYKNNNNYGK